MDDFTLNDLAAIERERDLPPDEHKPSLWDERDDEQWSVEDLSNAFLYGLCSCGAPRATVTTVDGTNTHVALVCSRDATHEQ